LNNVLRNKWFLGAFAKFAKMGNQLRHVSLNLYARPSAWSNSSPIGHNFNVIWYFSIFWKICRKNSSYIKNGKEWILCM